jgi:hypothetical protein
MMIETSADTLAESGFDTYEEGIRQPLVRGR